MATCSKEKCRLPVILEPTKLPGRNDHELKISHPDYVEPSKEDKDKAWRKTERAARRQTKLKAAAALAGKRASYPDKEAGATGAVRSMMPSNKPGEDAPKPRLLMPADVKSMMAGHKPSGEDAPTPRSMTLAGYKPGAHGPKPPPVASEESSAASLAPPSPLGSSQTS